jgi:hypothetical protein
MSKKLVLGILGGVLLATVLGVYIVIGNLNDPSNSKGGSSSEAAAETSEGAETVSGEKEEENESGLSNPFEENVKPPLSESLLQQYIHAMSHQKVHAIEKWSFFKITEERILFLLNQLEVNSYKNESLYREILLSWKEGDFSDAASHHNAVWALQDGTIGKASGLLSPKEEDTFLQEQNKESR